MCYDTFKQGARAPPIHGEEFPFAGRKIHRHRPDGIRWVAVRQKGEITMKKQIIAGGIVVIALCAMVLPKILNKKQFADPVADPVVEVTTPGRGDIRLTSSLIGQVEPEEVVYVYPKASGDVTEVPIKAGERVEAGQLLCVIDTRQIESAKSNLDSAQLTLRQAKEELGRQSVLYAAGGISEQAYRQYQNNVEAAQITYENAKTNYDNQVSYSQITAPISGMVEVCNVEPFDTVAQNNLLCVISGQGARIVSFDASERIRNFLSEGDPITVEKNGETFDGTIYEVSTMADSDTGLFQVKARLREDTDETKLPTGSSVKLYVTSEHADDVLLVPVNSVYYDGGLSYVYTYDRESGTLHKVQVEAGLYDSQWIEVRSGLDGTEEVLTTWTSELYEGTHVRIKGETDAQETAAEIPDPEMTSAGQQM